MKYSNLIDAVTGNIYEGKSYKKNDDEDAKSKKEKDQERKEAGKNKKQPVEESSVIAESKNKKIADLEKKVSDLEADKKDALNVLGTFSKAGQEKLKLAKEALAKAKKELTEGKSFKRNDDDDKNADDKKKEDKQKRDAKKQPVKESIAEAEELTYAEQDLIVNLRSALSKLWKISGDKSFVPNEIKANAKNAFTTPHASRVTLAHALRDLWQHSDKDLATPELKSEIFKALSTSGISEETLAVDESVFQDDEDHAGTLDEAYGRGWAILPATVALYNKKVVDITTAASEWASDKHPTSILVCHKNENGRDRMLFLSSSGDCRNQYKVGQSSETYHDQTGASKGIYTVLNIVVFQNGEMIYKANEEGLNKKASVAVFK